MPTTHVVARDASRRWRTARRIRRAVLLLGLVGMTSGAGLVTAGLALAANGSEPGNLILTPGSGASASTPTWSTTDGCPAGFQGSAQVSEFKPDGTFGSRISTTVNSGLTSPFGGTLDGNIRALLRLGAGVTSAGTVEFAVGCYPLEGGTGTVKYVQSTFVTLSSDGSSYTTGSSSGSPGPTSTPTHTPSSTPTPTPTGSHTSTPTSNPGPTSSILPSGAPQTGAGGASGNGNDLLIALGATLAAGSAAAMSLAFRRSRALPGHDGPDDTKPDGS